MPSNLVLVRSSGLGSSPRPYNCRCKGHQDLPPASLPVLAAQDDLMPSNLVLVRALGSGFRVQGQDLPPASLLVLAAQDDLVPSNLMLVRALRSGFSF